MVESRRAVAVHKYGKITMTTYRLQRVRDKLAAKNIPTQEEIYEELRPQLPRTVRHASGGFPDAKGISDVDISMYAGNHADLLHKFPEGTIPVYGDTKTLYKIPGYARPVEVFVSSDRHRLRRGLRHRKIALEIADRHPDLGMEIFKLKQQGIKTEPAIAQVLGLEGDPYESVLNRRRVLAKARKWNKLQRTKNATLDKIAALQMLHFLDKQAALAATGPDLLQAAVKSAKKGLAVPNVRQNLSNLLKQSRDAVTSGAYRSHTAFGEMVRKQQAAQWAKQAFDNMIHTSRNLM